MPPEARQYLEYSPSHIVICPEAGEAAEEDVAQLGHGHRGGAGARLGAGQLPGTQAVDHIAQPTANMRFIHF